MKNSDHDGLFVTVDICQIPLYYLLDTGSTMSVLHSNIFKKLPQKMQTRLKTSNQKLRMADGSEVRILGTMNLPLFLDNQVIHQLMLVADIEIHVVLGFDFMNQNKCVIDVSSRTMQLNNQCILCQLESQVPSLFRITVRENVTIPSQSEMIIPAKSVGTILSVTNFAIDSTTDTLKNKGILVAKSLCSLTNDVIPLNLINVSDKPRTIYKNTCAAMGQTVIDQDIIPIENLPRLESECEEAIPNQFQVILDRCQDQLANDQMEKLKSLLVNNQSVFSMFKFDLGLTNLVQHKIDAKDEKPVKIPPRRVPLAQRKEVETEIQKMVDNEIIQPSHSPWSKAMVVVKKPTGIIICLDYWKLNEVTVKDSYPLPRIDDSLDALRGNVWFSTVDLSSGCYQVGMDPSDASKTAFATSKCLFEFKRMLMGLSNACATFERLIEYVLAGMQWEICIVYLDDIIIFSRTFEEHLSRLQTVFF